MPIRETDLGHIYTEITVRPLAGSTKSWTGQALVDTGATDTFFPGSALRKLGILPSARRSYELADGSEQEMPISFGVIEVEGLSAGGTLVFAGDKEEPLLGVTVLESTGLWLDPRHERFSAARRNASAAGTRKRNAEGSVHCVRAKPLPALRRKDSRPSMSHELTITPSGHLELREASSATEALGELAKPIVAAFDKSAAHGLLHLATRELQARLPAALDCVRSFARTYLTRLCQNQPQEAGAELAPTPPPSTAELATWILQAPPMTGLEYLGEEALLGWWRDLDSLVRGEIGQHAGGAQAYLSEKNPLWRFVGRVTFHLAENKRDAANPFAFLATYASRLSAQGRVQHEPLGRALEQYAGAKNRQALLALLVPIQRAAEHSDLVKELVDSGGIYHPLKWSAREAHRFLQEVPHFEESGLIVRVPDWWKPQQPPRAIVNVRVDSRRGSQLSAASLLEFNVGVALDGEPLSETELKELLASVDGLVRLKGQWVEVDRDKLKEALAHWRTVERRVRDSGISFFEGMRLLAGASLDRDGVAALPEATREWTGLAAGPVLEAALSRLTAPEAQVSASPAGLHAELRPYQRSGLSWLHFLTQLGLGACLADDMGLGKTIQVIALLLLLKRGPQKVSGAFAAESLPTTTRARASAEKAPDTFCGPSLLVVPASLIANWKAEIARFAPSLTVAIAHPSETPAAKDELTAKDIADRDLVITTYGMLTRQEWLRKQSWRLAILDEAQAIKNAGTRQARAAKELHATARIALTGTPVENRLSDLWSLFDFLNPGLLGNAKAFADFVKKLEAAPKPSYQPLRTLVGPYLLRRLKTDKRVIADLPEKTEVRAYCSLSRQQAALYQQAIRDLEDKLENADGIQRRGLVLAQLMRLKQICNHPAQLLGQGDYDARASGKFQRLAELCEQLAQRQEKALVFTQFREITEPLAQFLEGVFARPGLVLHGGTAVARRRELVESFQRESGPPFLVLSLKAGGTGLNLTAASQVIHFDRWWNPAVEDQATDRAFRIGQKRNVLVHKFVCRGTVEERIDALIAEKTDLARNVVAGGERLLTEMDNDELLKFVALDVHKALDA
jgi:clan AA aspartic protease